MSFDIRTEQAGDAAAIRDLHDRAFETPWPGDAFMALWLGPPLSDAVGVLHYAPAFHDLEA